MDDYRYLKAVRAEREQQQARAGVVSFLADRCPSGVLVELGEAAALHGAPGCGDMLRGVWSKTQSEPNFLLAGERRCWAVVEHLPRCVVAGSKSLPARSKDWLELLRRLEPTIYQSWLSVAPEASAAKAGSKTAVAGAVEAVARLKAACR